MKLYVDDMRKAPEGWDQAWSFHEAIHMLQTGNYEVVSLDHDLGSFYGYKEMTGMDILNWIERQNSEGYGPHLKTIMVHTANASAANEMKEIARRLQK